MIEIRCWYCDRERQFFCDGEECDRPICKAHRHQLGAIHMGCRGKKGTWWDSTDVCPECWDSRNHAILKRCDRASPKYVKELLKQARNVSELKKLKSLFGEEKTKEAWHLLDESDRLGIKRICNGNT